MLNSKKEVVIMPFPEELKEFIKFLEIKLEEKEKDFKILEYECWEKLIKQHNDLGKEMCDLIDTNNILNQSLKYLPYSNFNLNKKNENKNNLIIAIIAFKIEKNKQEIKDIQLKINKLKFKINKNDKDKSDNLENEISEMTNTLKSLKEQYWELIIRPIIICSEPSIYKNNRRNTL